MEVSWYCWVTVISLVTNFHRCHSWPTLQPPLKPITSKHELDSDVSSKVLGSSVVTSVSIIMDHGNGTRTFLSDSVDVNPELKSNAIASPSNLLNPDRYEFYTFDEAGDLVKRLMTWDEIQSLVAGGDGDSLLGEASMPMYYSDSIRDKSGSTHIAANDFQVSDIQGVHKVVESVQNVLKSELAASQSKIPPVSKPSLLAQSPNWSLFLPTLLDNAEDGSEMNHLAPLINAGTANSTQRISLEVNSTTQTSRTTEPPQTTLKEYSRKTEKPIHPKPTTSKPLVPVKNSVSTSMVTDVSPTNSIFSSSSSPFPSTTLPNPFLHKKTYSTSKYGVFPSDSWSTIPTTKKLYTSNKWGGFGSTEEPVTISLASTSSTVKKIFSTSKYADDEVISTSKYSSHATNNDSTDSPFRRNTTITYGGHSSFNEYASTDSSTTKKPFTTSRYPSPSTNHKLHVSVTNVLNQVTADSKTSTTNSLPITNKTEIKSSTLGTSSPDRVISLSQFKTSTNKLSSLSSTTESQWPTEIFKSGSTEKKFPSSSSFTSAYRLTSRTTTESSKLASDPYQATASSVQNMHKFGLYSNKPVSIMDHLPSLSFPSTSFSSSLSTNLFQQKLSTEGTSGTPFSQFSSSFTSRKPVHSTFESSSTRKPVTLETSPSRLPLPSDLHNSSLASTYHFPSIFSFSTVKSTKTSETSTSPTTFTNLLKHTTSLTSAKPQKIKIPYTKVTSKPVDTFSHPLSLSTTSAGISEKPLIRISTLHSTIADQTTTKPEPLVTWISTSSLEDTPSKVSLFGVYDTDKLVTEQYVSSSNTYHPSISDFFRNSVTSTTSTQTSLTTSTEAASLSSLKTFSTSFHPVIDPETPKPKPAYSSTIHPVIYSSTLEDRIKVPEKSSTPAQAYNYTETVMQRVPTINPPNKSNIGIALKSSTRPQYMFTDSIKNMTQIAVMLNKLGESNNKATSIRNEYRNKVTQQPYETTKPVTASQVNDCITSTVSNTSKENSTIESVPINSRPPHHKLPTSEQKENSPIYYYKLPPVTSVADFTKIVEGGSTIEVIHHKGTVTNTSLKPTTEKEYLKITTVNRPDDVVQERISAVTNILLQTEGRVPNKEFIDSDSNSSQIPSTTESIMRTDEIELFKNPSTRTTVLQSSSLAPQTTTILFSKLQNATTTTSSEYPPALTTQAIVETDKPISDPYLEQATTIEVETEADSATFISTTQLPDFHNELTNDQNSSSIEDNSEIPLTRTNELPTKDLAVPTLVTSTSITMPSTSTTTPKSTVSSSTTPVPKQTEIKSTTISNQTLSTIADTSVKYIELIQENKTKIESQDSLAPPSSFRSPSHPTHRVSSSTISPQVELHPAPHESMGLEASIAYLGDDVKRFVDFCNELSFKIWTTQTAKNSMTSRSIVLSPFSVISTLAMIFLGARGSSSGIMNDFLKLDDMVTFNPHQVLQNITESAVNSKNIGVANSAVVREIFTDKSKGKVLDFYKERLQQYYDTHVEEVNFNSIGDIIRRRTNLLVKRQTQGRIQDYLKGTALTLKPPLAVFTSNIFQTDCEHASTDGRDGEMYFVVRPSTRQRRLVPIPAVVYRSGFLAGYEPGLDATAVTLNPESMVSTILVLPGQQGQVAPGDGLARLEQRLLESSYRRGAWSRLLRSLLFRPGLELQMPRFSHKSVLNLTAGLQKMGMEEIFVADKADLRGITGLSNELHLSDVVQVNMFSTCGETAVGARHHTETYPSSPQRVARINDIFDRTYLDDNTSNYYSSIPLNLRPRQARLPDNPRLRFDRPFLYIVRHNPTGMIIYIGRFNPRLLP